MRYLSLGFAALLSLSGSLAVLTPLPAHAQTCDPPPSGLVAWWPLNETGGTAVSDLTEQNPGTANGTIASSGNPKFVTGHVGTALNFFFGSRVNVSSNSSLDFGTGKSFTIDAWIKGHEGPIIVNFDSSTQRGFSLYHTGNFLRLTLGDGMSPYPQWDGSTTIDPNVWTFVAVVVDRANNTVTLYTSDGTGLHASSPPPPLSGAADAGTGFPLRIGGCPGNPNGCDKAIDEVEIFNRALAQSEIQDIYNAGSAGKCLKKGMTWTHLISNAVHGTITVGCNSSVPPRTAAMLPQAIRCALRRGRYFASMAVSRRPSFRLCRPAWTIPV